MNDGIQLALVILALASPFLIAVFLKHYFKYKSETAHRLAELDLRMAANENEILRKQGARASIADRGSGSHRDGRWLHPAQEDRQPLTRPGTIPASERRRGLASAARYVEALDCCTIALRGGHQQFDRVE